MDLIKFDFYVPHEAIKPYCGAVFCECNGAELSAQTGYLYVALRLVDRRMRERGRVYDEIPLTHDNWVDQALHPTGFKESQARENYPIRLCEGAARKLDLHLQIAAEDFRIWQATEYVPLRATPAASEVFAVYADSLPNVGIERVTAPSRVLCQEALAEKYAGQTPLFEEQISLSHSFTSEGIGVNEEEARFAIDAKDAELQFVVLQDERVFPALTGVLKNIGGDGPEAVEAYLLDADTNFLNADRQMIQTFISSEAPELNLNSVTITKIERVKEGRSYLAGLIKFTPRFDVYWEQRAHIVRNYKQLHVVDYYFDLRQTPDDPTWQAQVESSVNLVDQLNLSDLVGGYGDEAARIFWQMQTSLKGSEFIAKLEEWGYGLRPLVHPTFDGLAYESSVGVVMVRIRKDNDNIDEVMYVERNLSAVLQLNATNGAIRGRKWRSFPNEQV